MPEIRLPIVWSPERLTVRTLPALARLMPPRVEPVAPPLPRVRLPFSTVRLPVKVVSAVSVSLPMPSLVRLAVPAPPKSLARTTSSSVAKVTGLLPKVTVRPAVMSWLLPEAQTSEALSSVTLPVPRPLAAKVRVPLLKAMLPERALLFPPRVRLPGLSLVMPTVPVMSPVRASESAGALSVIASGSTSESGAEMTWLPSSTSISASAVRNWSKVRTEPPVEPIV